MKLTVKTVKDGAFELDVDPNAKVSALKAAIEGAKGAAYYADGLKVIFSGKVLKDDETLAGHGFKEGGFVVVMPGKPKAAAAPAAAKPKFGAAAGKPKDPVFQLNGKKWEVEHHINNPNIIIEDANVKQTVYIYKCQNSTIQIKGKINAITLDGCKKTAVVFENCVASCELVNCQSCQVQVTGAVPTVAIEKTDGAQIYLSQESLNCQIISAKSSEMNILLPVGEDNEFKEFAVPEQFKSSWDGAKLSTEMTDIAA